MTLEKDKTLKIFNYNQRAFGPFLLSIEEIRPHLLNPHLREGDLVRMIKEMSVKFTSKREQIADYTLDDDHVSAYTTLYLPTNIPKLHFLLSKLSDEVLNDLQDRPFVDVGTGPGTYALGWKLLMNGNGPMTAVDQSPKMLEQAKKMMKGFFPDQSLETYRKLSEERPESVLFFGHSINEMGMQKALELIITLNPEYVMWIEPGTSELFSELRKLRSFVLEKYDALYPCPASNACPSSWCHQVLRTSHEPSVERLSQLVSLDRKILPMAAHLYRRKKNASAVFPPTLIRYLTETKFSFEYEACIADEAKNILRTVEIQKRQLDKALEKTFKNLNVGERIDFDVEKIVESKLRIKLKL